MTQIDEKALDVAVESLRPLFREPVTYLEQAARDSIAAYLVALPPPAGEVGELMLRVAVMADAEASAETVKLIVDLRDALASLSARIAEAERERDEANARAEGQWAGWIKADVALRAATARAERLEAALREVREWIDNWSPSFVEDDEWPATADRMNAALSPTPAKGARDE